MAPKFENNGLNSYIGEGSAFQGRFVVQNSFQVDGSFEGELVVGENLIIGEKGRVKTKVLKANKANISGVLIGDVNVSEEVKLQATGRVLGNIKAPQVDIEPGALVQGSISITAGTNDNTGHLIEEAYKDSSNLDIDAFFGSQSKTLENKSSKGKAFDVDIEEN